MIFFILLLITILPAQVSRTPPKEIPFTPGPPIEQPIPFSHKTHSSTGLKCLECHAIEEPGDYAGFPSESKCMACHIAIKKDSPHIAKVAHAKQSATPIPWKRVYKVKEFVYFSHDLHHRKAGLSCETCHGPVQQREVLSMEKSVSMYACMRCHEQKKARNDCATCHDTH